MIRPRKMIFRGWPPESGRVVEGLSAANITAEVIETVVAGQGIAVVVSEIFVSEVDFATARRAVARKARRPSAPRDTRRWDPNTQVPTGSALAENRVNLRLGQPDLLGWSPKTVWSFPAPWLI